MPCVGEEQNAREPGQWIRPGSSRAAAKPATATAGARARLLALLVSATLIYILGLAVIEPHSRLVHVWADSGWPAMHAWVAVECFLSRGQQRFHRIAYFVLVAENAISIVALAYWSYLELRLGRLSPFPTFADVVFISYTPVYALAIFILTGGIKDRSLSLRHLGDVGISIGTMLIVGLLIYYVPSEESHLPTGALQLALAYPVLSCAATAFGLLALLQQPPGGLRRVIAIHLCALTMHATAYTLYGVAIMTRHYEVGHALDPLWFGGLALTVWAAREDRWLSVRPDAPARRPGPSVLDVAIPGGACAILAVTIGVFRDEVPRTPPLVMALATLLFVGSLAVRGLAVLRLERELTRENAALLESERAARAAAEQALCVREEFIQLASHELNTPVTSLLLNLEAAVSRLRRGQVKSEDMVRTATTAAQQARNVAQLVGDLMDFTQLEHDWLTLQPRPIELTGLIRSLVERAKPKLDWASCAVSLDLGPPITGSWDPLRIEKVVQKLLANAAKFGAGKPIEIKVERAGDLARVSIVDHGIGMDPSTQQRIFDRFARGVSAKHYGGLGLGLYVCRRLVEAHGGAIHVESKPGSGATFIVELPTPVRTETSIPNASLG
jgi:signal transduction histidine kinase